MKILLLGYGKEGQSAEKYFKTHFNDAEIDTLQNFDPKEIRNNDYSSYDIIIRSPSVPPLNLKNESSLTKYFFDHCPCRIIGVTATKGKGTTCSFIYSILKALKKDVYLVGNIGNPAIDILDELTENSVVVYEMSSFQLWDLKKSPNVAVIGTIEPDHLNVHKDYDDYLNAKSNICRHQSEEDYCIFYKDNEDSKKIAATSKAKKVPYPFEIPDSVKEAIKLPGKHNVENAIAAISAVASLENLSPEQFISKQETAIISGLADFRGLPHRLEFLRELNHVKYYDDNFSTNPSSTRVAINAFPSSDITIIIGGRDKTAYKDLPEIYEILSSPNIKNIVLIGESGRELMNRYEDQRFKLVASLEEAVKTAQELAEKTSEKEAIVLMSPAAASFDMFENVYDRGDKFKNLISLLN